MKFKKGAPPVICTVLRDPDWVLWGYEYTAVTFKKGYGVWSTYTVEIKQSDDGRNVRYPDLGDVTQFDSLEYINKRYGPPSFRRPNKPWTKPHIHVPKIQFTGAVRAVQSSRVWHLQHPSTRFAGCSNGSRVPFDR